MVVLPLTASLTWFQIAILWIAVVLTVWTGVEYWLDGKKAMAEAR